MKVILTAAFILSAMSASAFAQSPIVTPNPFQLDFSHAAQPFLQLQTRNGTISILKPGLNGMWWRDPMWVKTLGLTTDQQKKMDDAFQQYRLKLIDLTASLDKEELILEPLVESGHPEDQPKILSQIDRVADARAELEKANARMLLGIRQVLTQEQWSKLPALRTNRLYDLKNSLKFYKK